MNPTHLSLSLSSAKRSFGTGATFRARLGRLSCSAYLRERVQTRNYTDIGKTCCREDASRRINLDLRLGGTHPTILLGTEETKSCTFRP